MADDKKATLWCSNCGFEEPECDGCNTKFDRKEVFMECYEDGDRHFCSQDCFMDFIGQDLLEAQIVDKNPEVD